MRLPVDPAYAPELQLKVFDNRWGHASLVGTSAVPLAPLMPWNTKEYREMHGSDFTVEEQGGAAGEGRRGAGAHQVDPMGEVPLSSHVPGIESRVPLFQRSCWALRTNSRGCCCMHSSVRGWLAGPEIVILLG